MRHASNPDFDLILMHIPSQRNAFCVTTGDVFVDVFGDIESEGMARDNKTQWTGMDKRQCRWLNECDSVSQSELCCALSGCRDVRALSATEKGRNQAARAH